MRTYLLSGSRVPNKDVAGPAYSSTQLPSTVLWSATQGCAGDCKSRTPKSFSLPWLALCCTVLSSRWCQSGVNSTLVSTYRPPRPRGDPLPASWCDLHRLSSYLFSQSNSLLYSTASLLPTPPQ